MDPTATMDSVTVSWDPPESGGDPDRYIVHLKPAGGNKGSGRTKYPRARKRGVTFDDLESGATYKVWARAQNEAGKGPRTHSQITLPSDSPTPKFYVRYGD